MVAERDEASKKGRESGSSRMDECELVPSLGRTLWANWTPNYIIIL